MARFNTKSETTVFNHMGSRAIQQTPELELVSLLLTSMASDQYYRTAGEQLDRLRVLINQTDKLFVAKAALYARHEFGMRSMSHVTAAELARHIGGEAWAKRFYDKLIHRPDDMTETLSYYFANCGERIPNALRKGFANAFARFDAYQLAKYRGEGKGVKLVDVANLVHPKPVRKNETALKALIDNTLRNTETWEAKLSKAGQTAGSVQEKEALKAEAWKELLQTRKIGYFALLRNLRNIVEQAPELAEDACALLTDKRLIVKSLVLPFRFLSAGAEVEKLLTEQKNRTVVEQILKAIETAVSLSIDNLPVLKGKTVILSDNSGSMTGDRGNHSLMSRMSNVKTADIANLFAVMYWTKAEDTIVGLFGDRLIHPEMDRKRGLFENFKILDVAKNQCGGSTERGIFDMFEQLVREKMLVNTVVIFSDCQIGAGCNWYDTKGNRGADFMRLFETYRLMNPTFKCYSVDMKGYGTTVFDEYTIKLAGFSDKIFDLMKKGETDKDALVNVIRQVEI